MSLVDGDSFPPRPCCACSSAPGRAASVPLVVEHQTGRLRQVAGQVIEGIEHAQLLHTVSGVLGRIDIGQPNRLLDRSQTELEYLVMCQLRCIEDELLQHRGHVGKVLALLACIVRRGCQGLSQAQIAVAQLQQHRATIGTALQAAGSQPRQR